MSHRVACLRSSAVRVQVQPAAKLGHLPRHEHVRHVCGALLPAPCPNLQSHPLHAECTTARVHAPRSLAAFRLPARSPPRGRACPACDPRQAAYEFNQSLGWNTSSVTEATFMFEVRASPRSAHRHLQSLALSLARCLCTALAPHAYARGAPRASPLIPCTPSYDSRQYANSLSAANKLLIRCAWAGTPAFASAGYGSSWAPGSC
jgi:hypothetical protein